MLIDDEESLKNESVCGRKSNGSPLRMLGEGNIAPYVTQVVAYLMLMANA